MEEVAAGVEASERFGCLEFQKVVGVVLAAAIAVMAYCS